MAGLYFCGLTFWLFHLLGFLAIVCGLTLCFLLAGLSMAGLLVISVAGFVVISVAGRVCYFLWRSDFMVISMAVLLFLWLDFLVISVAVVVISGGGTLLLFAMAGLVGYFCWLDFMAISMAGLFCYLCGWTF